MKKLILLVLMPLLLISPSVVAIAPDDRDAVLGNYPFYDPTSTGGSCAVESFGSSGGNAVEYIWDYFLSRNFSPEQTAGIMGNLRVESCGTFDPQIREGCEIMSGPNDTTGVSQGLDGRGIAQWSYEARWQNLLNYADRSTPKRDPLSLDLQLDFIMFEMTGQPSVPGMTGGTGNAGTAYEMLQEMTSTGEEAVEEAAVIFARWFEVNQKSLDWSAGRISYEEAFRYRIDPSLDVYRDLGGVGVTGIACVPGGVSFEIVEGDTTHIPCQGNILNEDEVVGYKDGAAYNIRVCQIELPGDRAGPWVNSQISGAYSQMSVSAAAAGVSVAGGGFRTMESQVQARIRNGCPDIYNSPASACRIPTARPGYSNHQMGFAIDMSSIPVKSVDNCKKATINGVQFCQEPGNSTWEWLTAHANNYGLYQLRTEAWHWSVDGS